MITRLYETKTENTKTEVYMTIPLNNPHVAKLEVVLRFRRDIHKTQVILRDWFLLKFDGKNTSIWIRDDDFEMNPDNWITHRNLDWLFRNSDLEQTVIRFIFS